MQWLVELFGGKRNTEQTTGFFLMICDKHILFGAYEEKFFARIQVDFAS